MRELRSRLCAVHFLCIGCARASRELRSRLCAVPFSCIGCARACRELRSRLCAVHFLCMRSVRDCCLALAGPIFIRMHQLFYCKDLIRKNLFSWPPGASGRVRGFGLVSFYSESYKREQQSRLLASPGPGLVSFYCESYSRGQQSRLLAGPGPGSVSFYNDSY